MKVYELIMLLLSLWIVIHAVVGIRKLGFEDYSIGRGLGLWMWFCLKFLFLVFTAVIFIRKYNVVDLFLIELF